MGNRSEVDKIPLDKIKIKYKVDYMKKKNNILFIIIIVSFISFYLPLHAHAIIEEETIPELSTTNTDYTAPRKENVQNRMDIRDNRKEPGLQIKENVQMRKDNIENRQAIRTQKREEFQTRISTIKDEQKKAIVERLDQKFADVNKRQTDRMVEKLDRLTNITTRLQDRITALKTNGQDTTSAETVLANAQTAIETSKTAVATQAAKEYTPQITTESNLKQTVGATSSQLRTDLATTHKTVINAHKAVMKAHQAIVAVRSTTIPDTKEVMIPSGNGLPPPIVE